MNDEEMRQTVLQYLDAGRSGAAEAFRAVLAPDVVMWMPRSAADQFGRTDARIVGIDEFIEFAGAPVDHIYRRDTMEWTIHRSVVDGDLVWTQATLRAITPRDVEYENLYFILVRISEGLIAEIWESIDTAYAYAVFDAESPEALIAAKQR